MVKLHMRAECLDRDCPTLAVLEQKAGAQGPGLPTPTPGLVCSRNVTFPYNMFSCFVTFSVCAEA